MPPSIQAERITDFDLRQLIRKQIEELGSTKAFAESVNLSPQYICDVMKGRRDIAISLGAALGYERDVTWRLK